MSFTPKKSVQFAGDDEVNEFVYGSPYSEGSSTDSVSSTSTLQYINSQLIAHGFIRGSGISFEGLPKHDADKLSKCMLGMLGQRADEVSRMESVSTKLRTLTYENERLSAMQNKTEEQLVTAERETNVFKSRLNASNKALQASEAAHKATAIEMQRTRSAMQSLRQTHAAELKRKEKETEKMLDRWQKISDSQTKLGSTSSGIKFQSTLANPTSNLRDSEIACKGPSLLEDALEAAECSKREVSEENTSLKNLVVSVANELARILRACRVRATGLDEAEVHQFRQSEFFALSPPEDASEKMNELLSQFRGTVVNYDSSSSTPLLSPPNAEENVVRKPGLGENQKQAKEIQRLQNTIVDLRRQLDQAQTQKETGTYAGQAQEIVRRFVNNDDDKANVHERQLLEKIRKELDNARKKVDEAALALRDEKAAMEEERQEFQREQHLWRSQMNIPHDDDGSSKPSTGLDAYFKAPAEPLDLPMSPPRQAHRNKKMKSPKKTSASPRKPPPLPHASPARQAFAVGKVSKKSRTNASPKRSGGTLLGASSSKPKVIPPFETEVVPPAALAASGPSTSLMPDTFVLPAPSPLSSLPRTQPNMLSALDPIPAPSFQNAEDLDIDVAGDNAAQDLPVSPKRPFPVAKPFAQRMIHAYSPARPSPLSRILLMSNSPSQRSDDGTEVDSSPNDEKLHASGSQRRLTPLDQELKVEELMSSADDSPLRGKGKAKSSTQPLPSKGPSKKLAAASKEKRKEDRGPKPSAMKSTGTGKGNIKENGADKDGITAKQSTRPLFTGKGGARRVPIGSADAAPIGRGRK